MSKLGIKELVLGATLMLPGATAEAQPNKDAEVVLRAHCAQIAETARKETRAVFAQLEIRAGGMAFAPDYAAERAETACLERMGVVEPKASDIKK